MKIDSNVSLKTITTMELGGAAQFVAHATTKEEVAELFRKAKQDGQKVVVLGGGSNTLAHDEGFNGLIILNEIAGMRVVGDDESSTTLTIGGGEVWDDAVSYSVEKELSGIEALSHIPGTVGAAPVQNIGAYGQELANTFVELEAYDSQTDSFVILDKAACGFSYRHSIFRGESAGRYAITSVTLRLKKAQPQPPFYRAIEDYLTQHHITDFSVENIRSAVITIRKDKLPDPKVRPNSGSFFKNAFVSKEKLEQMLAKYPTLPYYPAGDEYKIPSGWLIEQAGFKGTLLHGVRVNDKNTLVLINESATSFSDLDAARNEIIMKVNNLFEITLTQEPLELSSE